LKKSAKQIITGVVLLDKPTGMSSNRALQKVKTLFNAKKAGHTGNLDPLATGLLPICFGQATKASEYCLDSHKRYQTTIKLGQVTDTLDSEGEIIESNAVDVSDQQIEQALQQFRGDIKQVPPMFSALKRDGKPLYKLARKGEVVDRPARDMTVHSLTMKRVDDLHVQLNVHCSSGFYIRSLAHDLGQVLGCGAHVVELRRTQIKHITLENTYSIEQLADPACREQAIQPVDVLLSNLPMVEISDQQVESLSHGKKTHANGLAPSELTRFYRSDSSLFAVGEIQLDGVLKTHKIFVPTA